MVSHTRACANVLLPLPGRLWIRGLSFRNDFLMLISSHDQSELEVLSTITLRRGREGEGVEVRGREPREVKEREG